MIKTRAFGWHSRFRNGDTSVEDAKRSGRPSTSKTDEIANRVKDIVRNDPRVAFRMISTECLKQSCLIGNSLRTTRL